jgi:hypothetical protein
MLKQKDFSWAAMERSKWQSNVAFLVTFRELGPRRSDSYP